MAVTTPRVPGWRLARGLLSFMLVKVPRGYYFDPDALGKTLVETQPGVADLTQDVGLQAQEFDLSILAEAHLAQALVHIGGGGKLSNNNSGARPGAAEGQESWGRGLL